MKSLLLCCLSVMFLCPLNTWAQEDPNPAKTRALELRNALKSLADGGFSQNSWDEVRTGIDNYQKNFGVTSATNNNVVLLRKFQLSVAKKFVDQGPYLALLQQLADDPLPAVADLAKEQLAVQKRLEDLKTKPIELQFTAVDGTSVDLASMRGKVVLVDFWASWCPECATQAPAVAELYQKYHTQGLEVVGISLDEDKEAMLAFAKQHGMTWPQFFDGKKWQNAVSQRFGIRSIPTIWIVDKNGFVVSMNADENLAAQLVRLLDGG